MKIIFLDIDGVLNHEKWMVSRFEKVDGNTIASQYPFYEFDPESVVQLNRITDATEAKIVVSSTWRLGRTVDQLKELLKSVGATGEVIDKTIHMGAPSQYGSRLENSQPKERIGYTIPRGCEIDYWLKDKFQRINWSREQQKKYLEERPVKNYIILDDDSDMLLNQREHFIKTGWKDGLTKEKADRAIEVLQTSILDLYYNTDKRSYLGLG